VVSWFLLFNCPSWSCVHHYEAEVPFLLLSNPRLSCIQHLQLGSCVIFEVGKAVILLRKGQGALTEIKRSYNMLGNHWPKVTLSNIWALKADGNFNLLAIPSALAYLLFIEA